MKKKTLGFLYFLVYLLVGAFWFIHICLPRISRPDFQVEKALSLLQEQDPNPVIYIWGPDSSSAIRNEILLVFQGSRGMTFNISNQTSSLPLNPKEKNYLLLEVQCLGDQNQEAEAMDYQIQIKTIREMAFKIMNCDQDHSSGIKRLRTFLGSVLQDPEFGYELLRTPDFFQLFFVDQRPSKDSDAYLSFLTQIASLTSKYAKFLQDFDCQVQSKDVSYISELAGMTTQGSYQSSLKLNEITKANLLGTFDEQHTDPFIQFSKVFLFLKDQNEPKDSEEENGESVVVYSVSNTLNFIVTLVSPEQTAEAFEKVIIKGLKLDFLEELQLRISGVSLDYSLQFLVKELRGYWTQKKAIETIRKGIKNVEYLSKSKDIIFNEEKLRKVSGLLSEFMEELQFPQNQVDLSRFEEGFQDLMETDELFSSDYLYTEY